MPIWLQILIAVGNFIFVILAGVGFTAYFAERAKHKAQKKNKAEDNKEAEEVEKQQKLEEMEHQEMVKELAKELTKELIPQFKIMVDEAVAPIKAGVQDTCRYDLDELTSKADAQGWFSKYDKQRYDHMYKSYHDLGVNGVMTAAYERVMHLPDKPIQRKPRNNSNKK